jgi:antitoxin component YwqK of YwqJK toxin-antitoxin module
MEAVIREGPDYQAVLPELGDPILPDTAAGVRDNPRSAKHALAQSYYCRLDVGTFVLVRDRGWGIIVEGDYDSKFTVEFEDDIAGITTTGVYECGPYEDDAPVEIEAFRTSNKWGERYYWTRHEVRKEFASWLDKYGQIHYYAGGELTRIVFPNGIVGFYDGTPSRNLIRAESATEIRYYAGDFKKLTHIKYIKDHEQHGEIRHFDGSPDKLTRIEYSKDHKQHGQIRHYDGSVDKLTRVEFSKDHKMHGQIHYCAGGELTRIEFSKDHEQHGQIRHYDGSVDKLTRVEFSKDHEQHGQIRYYDGSVDKLTRVEYSKDHEQHGQIRHYDGSVDKLTRVEFSKDQEQHGKVWYYDGSVDKLTRIEYSEGHPMHGEIRHFEAGKLSKIDFPDGRSFVPEDKKRKRVEVLVIDQ